ncbi:MAG TPA: hypothetical protein VMR54_08425 [Thermoanaerobaculia bacterium]|nr:hypothetical protein [Thermoanaerobaculia bacterium]
MRILPTTDIPKLVRRGVETPVPRPGRRVLELRGKRRRPLAAS